MPPDSPLKLRIINRIKYQLLGMTDRSKEMVIGVGLPKTATTSLCDALTMLGYRTIHYPAIFKFEGDDVRLHWPWWMSGYDAMADLPAAVLYRELSERFPNARFILTLRDMESWLRSSEKHFSREHHEATAAQPQFQDAVALYCHKYGRPWFDRESFVSVYQQHEQEVREYFAGSSRFTAIDFGAGDGWQELAGFLQRDIPDKPFPKSNEWQPGRGGR